MAGVPAPDTDPRRDPYRGILSGPVDGPRRVRAIYPDVPAVAGLIVVHRDSCLRGRVVRLEKDAVVVRTEMGTERVLRPTPGAFLVDGRAVTLIRPIAPAPGQSRPARTSSGSVVLTDDGAGRRARVARASRLWVEGVHDAELVEKVWGDDLRIEGVVVERLDGLSLIHI